jgi:hypothetical protein
MNSVLNEIRMDSNRIAVTMVTNPVYANYATFSTNLAGNPTIPRPAANASAVEKEAWGSSASLEAIHGAYHVLIGGWHRSPGGHMSHVPCAAFDPIFWAHHGNIERLFTVWQAVHARDANNWLSNPNQEKDPLLPFLKPANIPEPTERFWTSKSAKNWETFGYTYPDLDAQGISIADKFRNLYDWSIPRFPGAPRQDPPPNMKPIPASKFEFLNPPSQTGSRTVAAPAPTFGLRSVENLAPQLASHARKLQVPISAKAESHIAWDWYADDHVER